MCIMDNDNKPPAHIPSWEFPDEKHKSIVALYVFVSLCVYIQSCTCTHTNMHVYHDMVIYRYIVTSLMHTHMYTDTDTHTHAHTDTDTRPNVTHVRTCIDTRYTYLTCVHSCALMYIYTSKVNWKSMDHMYLSVCNDDQ